MKKIVVVNWKMHPQTLAEAIDLYRFTSEVCGPVKDKVLTVVCPPFVYLEELSKIESDVLLGAQDCHWEKEGAFTGEVSPTMLENLRVKYVLVGHSERRLHMGETNEMIARKIRTLVNNNLTPILAIGEKHKGEKLEEVLFPQLRSAFEDIERISSKVIIAYEPVWAIGADESDTPEHATEIVKFVRTMLFSNPVLYGGSVNHLNIRDFVLVPEIAGVLIGGASVDKEEFKKIIEAISDV